MSSTADTEEDVPEATPARQPGKAERPWWIRRYTFTGTAVGLIFIWFSMTPSLLPRGALFQGLVSGVSGAIGYGLGVFSVWLVRYMRSKDSSPPAAALVVAGADPGRRDRHGHHGDPVPRLAGPRARPDGRRAPQVVRLPGGGDPVGGGAVRLRRNRPVDSAADHLSGRAGRPDRAVSRLGDHRGVPADGADDHAAQRRRGQVRDARVERHLRVGQRRNESQYRATAFAAAIRWSGVAGVVEFAGSSGPDLRAGRPHRRAAGRVQRNHRDRTDPGIRRAGLGGRHRSDRGIGRA